MENESKKEINDRSQWSVAINKQTSKQNTHTRQQQLHQHQQSVIGIIINRRMG